MNREDIIRMAREAGARAQQNKNCDVEYLFSVEQIERLLAAEREACAKVCEERIDFWQRDDGRRYEDEYCADAIRARG
jgi:hypothetical protein